MPIDLIIRNAQVVTPDGVKQQDLFIDAGRFVAPATAAKETIDATGLTAFPGLIDSHVHFNEPGRTDWEGVATGSAALAAGGGTCFFDMPLNSSPPVLLAKLSSAPLPPLRRLPSSPSARRPPISTACTTQSARRSSSSMRSTSLRVLVSPNISSERTCQDSPDCVAAASSSRRVWSEVPSSSAGSKPSER